VVTSSDIRRTNVWDRRVLERVGKEAVGDWTETARIPAGLIYIREETNAEYDTEHSDRRQIHQMVVIECR
jgi:hypothetical protein